MDHGISKVAARRAAFALAAIAALAACSASTTGPVQPDEDGQGGAPSAATPGANGEAAEGPAAAGGSSTGEAAAEEPSGGASGGTSRAARLAFRLVDAPNTEVSQIVVTIAKLEADLEGTGWTTLFASPKTVDLLTLQGGASLDLGTAEIPPGRVGGLRLVLADGGDAHVTLSDGRVFPLVVPSGTSSGIKLKGSFDVPACATGEITLDFDGAKSIDSHPTGKGTWMLRPVVRIKAVATRGTCEQDAGADGASSDPSEADASAATPDPCAGVVCADTELCENGACRPAEE